MKYPHAYTVLTYACSTLLALIAAPIAFAVDSTSNTVAAAESNLNYDPLHFSDFSTYNPLKKDNAVTHYKGGTNTQALSNEDLNQLADNSRSGEMSASQRALNQQWLAQHGNEGQVNLGGHALQKILQIGFKTYWDSLRQTKFKAYKMIPDSEGQGNFGSATQYQLRLSDDKIKLAVEYNF